MIDPNGSDYDAINAERTQRWAAEDAAKQGVRGPNTGYQAYDGAPKQPRQAIGQVAPSPIQAVAPSAAVPETTFEQDSNARQANISGLRAKLNAMESFGRKNSLMGFSSNIGYADGGKPETADELMARMSAKYGAPAAGPVAPAPQPQTPPPAPAPTPKPQGGLIQQAAGLFSNRAKQIDKAAGYALGGKITGPGTATSDSIPAQTGTGQPIRVANGERIVSVEQDKALARIAEMLGYESVDVMFEALTGKPVGPTIKGGSLAAANGYKDEDGTYHPMSVAGAPAPQGGGSIINYAAAAEPASAAKPQKDFSGEFLGGLKNYMASKTPVTNEADAAKLRAADDPFIVGPGRIGTNLVKLAGDAVLHKAPDMAGTSARAVTVQPQASYSNEGRARPEITAQPPGAVIQAAGQPVDTAIPPDLTTKDIVPGGYLDRGNGIVAQRGKTGQLNVTNVGTEALTDQTRRAVDDSASALRDQQGSTYNPAAQLARMQALRMTSDTTDDRITDPAAKKDAVQGLAILQAARQGDLQAQTSGIQNQTAQQQLVAQKQIGELHAQYLAAKDPVEQAQLAAKIRALSGKAVDPKYTAHVVKGQIGEPDHIVTTDDRTGQPAFAGTGGDVQKQLAAKAAPAAPTYDQYKAAMVKRHGDKVTEKQLQDAYKKQFSGAK